MDCLGTHFQAQNIPIQALLPTTIHTQISCIRPGIQTLLCHHLAYEPTIHESYLFFNYFYSHPPNRNGYFGLVPPKHKISNWTLFFKVNQKLLLHIIVAF
jgi:hypothetical protein